jgi:cephalosporin hydroxylase
MSYTEDYSQKIPDDANFKVMREKSKMQMGEDDELRKQAIELTVLADKYQYGYQWEWCGVPIIRHPDDIVLQQEIVWKLKPQKIIETGVARGGSLVLSSSLMSFYTDSSKVLGIDLKIFDHARAALSDWLMNGRIEIFESDSTSLSTIEKVQNFLAGDSQPILLVLDSNHSEAHVLNELNAFGPLIPRGSIIMVADTIVQEMPLGYYKDRPWGPGDNPLTAVTRFLSENQDFTINMEWCRRSLMGECRDGILIKI